LAKRQIKFFQQKLLDKRFPFYFITINLRNGILLNMRLIQLLGLFFGAIMSDKSANLIALSNIFVFTISEEEMKRHAFFIGIF